MSCQICQPLTRSIPIRLPEDVWSVVRKVRAAIADGIIEELASDDEFQPQSLDRLHEGQPWDDWLSLRFGCLSCRQTFRLQAETYHGRGGEWYADERKRHALTDLFKP